MKLYIIDNGEEIEGVFSTFEKLVDYAEETSDSYKNYFSYMIVNMDEPVKDVGWSRFKLFIRGKVQYPKEVE